MQIDMVDDVFDSLSALVRKMKGESNALRLVHANIHSTVPAQLAGREPVVGRAG